MDLLYTRSHTDADLNLFDWESLIEEALSEELSSEKEEGLIVEVFFFLDLQFTLIDLTGLLVVESLGDCSLTAKARLSCLCLFGVHIETRNNSEPYFIVGGSVFN